ncbi:DUF2889 domain-containing protein [Sphingobium phenoxybenzoativorans]|uniref:DUF2889 domain-containing protein n=1 Tax=Sphingobium phenoxybenzoativorans TaxID=1592790 RepID=UPI00149615B1|nr:DUF2889 domain-containing protein [Sphingobium phenoxybenzoativorans]
MILSDDSMPFWRNISLRATAHRVEGELVDNVHHFLVAVDHDGRAVTAVTGDSVRVPWVTCPSAAGQLTALVATPISISAKASIDQTRQCTHMLDLARLAIAQAARGGQRDYRVRVQYDPVRQGVAARLERDGAPFLDWLVRDGVVVSDGPFHGHDTHGRSVWSDAVMADPDLREAGLVLRRCIFVYRSRDYSAARRRASDTANMEGVCYSFQPERASLAFRPPGFRELP